MFEWSEELQMVRDAVRTFVDTEIRPHREDLEHGDLPPYDLLRKLYKTFGMDQMAADTFDKRIAAEEQGGEGSTAASGSADRGSERDRGSGGGGGFTLLPIIELCKCSPGMVTAMGVSVGLTAAAIMSKGTTAQKKRWARDVLTMDKIGAWAITEPNSGSDAFGQMASTARRDGDEYVINGSKTFITNGPYADTIVFICKLDEGNAPADRKVVQFVLDSGMPGLEQSKPLRKMGLHSSPTGMLFLDDVRAGRDRLLGESEEAFGGGKGREASKATFVMERSGVAAMALGIIERCLELSVKYAKERVQFGKPIGEFQLIQLKLANMEVARLNVENLVFRVLESSQAGKPMNLSEASAMKLYAAGAATDVALEAVQLFGGNGYMSEYEVEQLARDAKVLQIYAGTDEIQVGQIARALLA
jgi:alkylation response protein AidB-like acyl-CoA dehydrogenase